MFCRGKWGLKNWGFDKCGIKRSSEACGAAPVDMSDQVVTNALSAKEPFVLTLTLTDITTQWTENRAVWTKNGLRPSTTNDQTTLQ